MTDPPPGLIPVPMKGAVLLLSDRESTAGSKRVKRGRGRGAVTMHTPRAPTFPAPPIGSARWAALHRVLRPPESGDAVG